MLARLTEAIAKLDSNIRQIEADTGAPGRGNIEVVVEVRDRAAPRERVRAGVCAACRECLEVGRGAWRRLRGRDGRELA